MRKVRKGCKATCKSDFPKTNLCVDKSILVCRGIGRRYKLKLSGRRNVFASILGKRKCAWQSGTTPGFAAAVRSNSHTQPNWRLPPISECHALIFTQKIETLFCRVAFVVFSNFLLVSPTAFFCFHSVKVSVLTFQSCVVCAICKHFLAFALDTEATKKARAKKEPKLLFVFSCTSKVMRMISADPSSAMPVWATAVT